MPTANALGSKFAQACKMIRWMHREGYPNSRMPSVTLWKRVGRHPCEVSLGSWCELRRMGKAMVAGVCSTGWSLEILSDRVDRSVQIRMKILF